MRQHCFASQNADAKSKSDALPPEQRTAHAKKVVLEQKRRADRAVLENAIQLQRERLLAEAKAELVKELHPNLSDAEVAERVATLRMLYRIGIPVYCLRDEEFRARMERGGIATLGATQTRATQKFLLLQLIEKRIAFFKDRLVSTVGDGSKLDRLIEAQLARFVDDDGKICECVYGCSVVKRSMDSAGLDTIFTHQRERVFIRPESLQAEMNDSASTNLKRVKDKNTSYQHLPDSEVRLAHSIFMVQCFSHGFTNNGNVLLEACSNLKEFLRGFNGLNVSDSAAEVFREICGTSIYFGSSNRWFYYLRTVKIVHDHFGSMRKFVGALETAVIMPKKTARMAAVLANSRTFFSLALELKLLLLFGRKHAETAYFFEGKGMVSPFVYERLNDIHLFLTQAGKSDSVIFKEFCDYATRVASTIHIYQSDRDDLISKVWSMKDKFVNYWQQNINIGMRSQIDLFKGLQLLDPCFAASATELEINVRLDLCLQRESVLHGVRSVSGVKGFTEELKLELVQELSIYRVHGQRFAQVLRETPPHLRPWRLWEWWWSMRLDLPGWFQLAHRGVLIQPSSASIERFFSQLKGNSSDKQSCELDETLECRALCIAEGDGRVREEEEEEGKL